MFNWVEDGEDPLGNVTIEKEIQEKKDINFVQDLEFDSKINSILHIPDTQLLVGTSTSLYQHDLEKEKT